MSTIPKLLHTSFRKQEGAETALYLRSALMYLSMETVKKTGLATLRGSDLFLAHAKTLLSNYGLAVLAPNYVSTCCHATELQTKIPNSKRPRSSNRKCSR